MSFDLNPSGPARREGLAGSSFQASGTQAGNPMTHAHIPVVAQNESGPGAMVVPPGRLQRILGYIRDQARFPTLNIRLGDWFGRDRIAGEDAMAPAPAAAMDGVVRVAALTVPLAGGWIPADRLAGGHASTTGGGNAPSNSSSAPVSAASGSHDLEQSGPASAQAQEQAPIIGNHQPHATAPLTIPVPLPPPPPPLPPPPPPPASPPHPDHPIPEAEAEYGWTKVKLRNLDPGTDGVQVSPILDVCVKPLGGGTTGSVYPARHNDIDYALKVTDIHSANHEVSVDQLIKTKCQQLDVQRQGVMEVLGYGEILAEDLGSETPITNNIQRFGILMLRGQSVDVKVGELFKGWDKTPAGLLLALEVLLNIYGQAATSLLFLHTLGFQHRDVKSGNLILFPDGRVFLGDLGTIALVEGAGHSDHYATTFMFCNMEVTLVGLQSWVEAHGRQEGWPPEAITYLTGLIELLGPDATSYGLDVWSLGISFMLDLWAVTGRYLDGVDYIFEDSITHLWEMDLQDWKAVRTSIEKALRFFGSISIEKTYQRELGVYPALRLAFPVLDILLGSTHLLAHLSANVILTPRERLEFAIAAISNVLASIPLEKGLASKGLHSETYAALAKRAARDAEQKAQQQALHQRLAELDDRASTARSSSTGGEEQVAGFDIGEHEMPGAFTPASQSSASDYAHYLAAPTSTPAHSSGGHPSPVHTPLRPRNPAYPPAPPHLPQSTPSTPAAGPSHAAAANVTPTPPVNQLTRLLQGDGAGGRYWEMRANGNGSHTLIVYGHLNVETGELTFYSPVSSVNGNTSTAGQTPARVRKAFCCIWAGCNTPHHKEITTGNVLKEKYRIHGQEQGLSIPPIRVSYTRQIPAACPTTCLCQSGGRARA